jgi:drug/metabolite transporter (DMT)-like permease
MNLSARQLWVLVLLTLVWGLNWPVMKLGVSGTATHPLPYPPLTFRALSMIGGLPVLALALWFMKVPLRLPREHIAAMLKLAVPNMMVWHVIIISALPYLSSGRTAILGYTMPVFSAMWGVVVFGDRLGPRQFLGVTAATVGVLLLLAHEFGRLAGAPLAAGAVLVAACIWAYGTHRLRRSTIPLPLLTVVFWMTAATALLMSLLAALFESARWSWPSPIVSATIAYNAVGVFAFAQAAWFYLARTLPPVASSISVMMIPVLGTFTGAWWLGEALHWQDYAAIVLMLAAIASVLGPQRPVPGTR